MNKINNVLKGSKLFVIPNAIHSPWSDLWQVPLASIGARETESMSYCMRKNELKKFGITTELTDRFVQVWILCDGSDNLSDHGFNDEQLDALWPNGLAESEREYASAPSFLPISIFEGKKEGDSITLTTTAGVKWDIELCQLGYRYARFGKFEEVLAMLERRDLVEKSKRERSARILYGAFIREEYAEDDVLKELSSLFSRQFEELTHSADRDGVSWIAVKDTLGESHRIFRCENGRATTLQYNLVQLSRKDAAVFDKIKWALTHCT